MSDKEERVTKPEVSHSGHEVYGLCGGNWQVDKQYLVDIGNEKWHFCRSVELNPEYGDTDYERDNEIKDSNDYYFYSKPGDEIEITDTNEYYFWNETINNK